MPHRTLREIVGDQDLLHVTPETSVRDTARRMAERHVAAVLVIDGGELLGIFTERDLLQRVVAAGLDPESSQSPTQNRCLNLSGPNSRGFF